MAFTKRFDLFVCDHDYIETEMDGFTCRATIYRDESADPPDQMQDGFWPSRNPDDAGYCDPKDFDDQQALAERIMRAWKQGEWFYCGVAVTVSRANIQLTEKYANALWGVECNYPGADNSYLLEVANELLDEALAEARVKIAELTT